MSDEQPRLYRRDDTCPNDTDGDGDCAMCARNPKFHRRYVEVGLIPVPWCETHDAEWVRALDQCWRGRGQITRCRLQEQPKVWKER